MPFSTSQSKSGASAGVGLNHPCALKLSLSSWRAVGSNARRQTTMHDRPLLVLPYTLHSLTAQGTVGSTSAVQPLWFLSQR